MADERLTVNMQAKLVGPQAGQLGLALGRVRLHLHRLTLGVLVLVGAGLRLFGLADKSLWLDEAFSITLSQRSPLEIIRATVLTDLHPPLYYLVLNLWLGGGSHEGHVRLLSALLSIASIGVVYKLASALFDDTRAGLVAAAVLAFSPYHIWYAQEGRMYAMLVFLVLVSAHFFILALRGRSAAAWLGFILATTLALYTDNGALWYVAAIGLFYLISVKHFPGTVLAWALSQAAIGLLYAPWLPAFWEQTQRVTERFWIPPPSFQAVLGALLDFNSFNFPWMPASILYMTVVLVWTYIVPSRAGWQRPLLTLWLIAPIAISLLLSLRQPIFLSRNLIVASLGYYLLVAGMIATFKGDKAAVVLVLPLVLMNLVSVGHNLRQEAKEDWRAAAAYVAESAWSRTGGLIVFVPSYAELPFHYYFQQYDRPLKTQGFPADETLLHPRPGAVADLDALFADQPYVWLVLRDVEAADPNWTVKNWLDSHGYRRVNDFVRDGLAVITYIRWDQFPSADQLVSPKMPVPRPVDRVSKRGSK